MKNSMLDKLLALIGLGIGFLVIGQPFAPYALRMPEEARIVYSFCSGFVGTVFIMTSIRFYRSLNKPEDK